MLKLRLGPCLLQTLNLHTKGRKDEYYDKKFNGIICHIEESKGIGGIPCRHCRVDDLRSAPSFTFAPKMPSAGEGIGTRKSDNGLKPGEVNWPENARSIIVIAVAHPEEAPEMDWWYGRVDPPGNRVLAKVCRELCPWIEESFGINTVHLPYHVEKGGTYLKDSAVMAGLGCIGRNNIVITPEYGPRVRLRALTVDVELPSTGPINFDPCKDCKELCRKACPQHAFDKMIYEAETYGQDILPGQDAVSAARSAMSRWRWIMIRQRNRMWKGLRNL